jgi:hypothetical protein
LAFGGGRFLAETFFLALGLRDFAFGAALLRTVLCFMVFLGAFAFRRAFAFLAARRGVRFRGLNSMGSPSMVGRLSPSFHPCLSRTEIIARRISFHVLGSAIVALGNMQPSQQI